MGCSSSSIKGYPNSFTSQTSNFSSTRLSVKSHAIDLRNFSLPSTGGLQIILQTVFLRESLRKFVSQSWVPVVLPQAKKNNSPSNTAKSIASALNENKSKMQEMRDLALNSIDFWVNTE